MIHIIWLFTFMYMGSKQDNKPFNTKRAHIHSCKHDTTVKMKINIFLCHKLSAMAAHL